MERFIQRRWRLLGVAIVLGAGVLYVGGTPQCGALGFPLDDGWIHQTYERNLASTGQLAYVPGQVSLGSTSPLWTVVLSLGYVLRLPPVLWSYVLGGAGWLATAWTAAALAQRGCRTSHTYWWPKADAGAGRSAVSACSDP